MSDRPDRVAEMFERARAEDRTPVVIFVPGGWPELDATVDVVLAAVEGGADAVEIGLPFSDPLGDGPANQQAYLESIENGFGLPQLLEVVRTLRSRDVRVPHESEHHPEPAPTARPRRQRRRQ